MIHIMLVSCKILGRILVMSDGIHYPISLFQWPKVNDSLAIQTDHDLLFPSINHDDDPVIYRLLLHNQSYFLTQFHQRKNK
jgi:hypothetical protein